MPAYTNARQNIPALFREIMDNQADQQALLDAPFVTFADCKHLRVLKKAMDDMRTAAERVLCWNTNKGEK